MTPYELMLFVETKLEKEEQDMNSHVQLVWLGEYYHRLKKLPSLKEVMDKKNNKEMSAEEMLSVVKKLNERIGGKEIKAERR